MKESVNLDILRSVAVLSVLLAHVVDIATDHAYAATTRLWGQMGVIIFFVHTSIVLLQSLERNKADRSPAVSFYLRRIFRIYPLAIVCVILAAIFDPTINVTAGALASNLALTQNLTMSDHYLGVLWSLPLELQMYVVLPPLYWLARGHAPWLMLAVWAAAVPLAVFQPSVSARLNVIGYAPCFLAGVLSWSLAQRLPRLLPGWPLALASLIGFWTTIGDPGSPWQRGLFCLALGCAIPMFKEVEHLWVARPAKVIATYSYGIYLSHIPAITLGMALPAPLWVRYAVAACLVVTLPVAMYHLIEAPMIRYGARVARLLRRERRTADDARLAAYIQ